MFKCIPFVYSCVWCDMKFSNPSFIRFHVRSKHCYNCNDCLKEIKTLHQFLVHANQCKYAHQDISYYSKSK